MLTDVKNLMEIVLQLLVRVFITLSQLYGAVISAGFAVVSF